MPPSCFPFRHTHFPYLTLFPLPSIDLSALFIRFVLTLQKYNYKYLKTKNTNKKLLSIRRCQYVASPDVVNYDAVQFPYSDCFHQTFLILLESSIVTVSLHLKQRNHEK